MILWKAIYAHRSFASDAIFALFIYKIPYMKVKMKLENMCANVYLGAKGCCLLPHHNTQNSPASNAKQRNKLN